MELAARPRVLVCLAALALALGSALAGAGGAAAEPPGAQLAMWSLDEVSGDVAYDDTGIPQPDGSVVLHNGTYVNAPTLGVPGAPPEDAGTAAEFDGASQLVRIPYTPDLNPPTYTIEAWVRPTAYPVPGSDGTDSKAIFCSRDGTGLRGFMLYLDDYVGHPQFAFVVGAGATRHYVYDAADASPSLGSWHHVVGTFDGSVLRIYVDGVDVSSPQLDDNGGATPGGGPEVIEPNPGEPEYIGGCSGPSGERSFFPGTLDEVALYNGALNPDDVQRHFRTLAAHRPARPLVFIPGTTGTYLSQEGKLVWPREESLATSTSDSFLNALELTSTGQDKSPPAVVSHNQPTSWDGIIMRTAICNEVPTLNLPLPPVLPGDYPAIGNLIGKEQVCKELARKYEETRRILEGMNYEDGVTLFPYGYDWRKSADFNEDGLLRKIDAILALPRFANRGITSVDILAHSQGGLVTSALLHDPRSDGKVHRVVTLGTPYLGTPKFLSVLRFREPCEAAIFGVCLLNREEVQKLVQHFPGSLELLPSRKYYDATTPPVLSNVYSNDLRYETWSQVFTALGEDFGIRQLLDDAQAFHDDSDVWSHVDASVELLRIAGTGLGTIATVRELITQDCSPLTRILHGGDCTYKAHLKFLYGSGDGTVIRYSASLRNCQRSFDLPGAADRSFVLLVKKYGHEQLAADGGILRQAVGFLRNGASGTSKCPVRRTSAVAATPGEADASSEFGLTGSELAVDGPLAGNVASADGDITGVVNPDLGISIEAIPHSAFNDSNDSESFFAIDDAQLKGAWTATDAGDIAFQVHGYQNDEIATTAAALSTHVERGARVSIDYAQPLPLGGLAVAIDDDANGSVDREIPFGPTLTGAAAADQIPPTSTVQVERFPGKKCLSSALVTVSAADEGGAGVARIDYLVGATNATGVYTAPLTLPAAGEIFVRAVDAAGNMQPSYAIGTLDDRPGLRSLVTEFLTPHFNTTGCIDYPGDVDWWGLQLAAGSHKFQLIGLSSDYDLALFDAAGNQLGESASTGNRSEKIAATLAAGRYYLRVVSKEGAWSKDHPYRLNVH